MMIPDHVPFWLYFPMCWVEYLVGFAIGYWIAKRK
jgi:hypothetical protein